MNWTVQDFGAIGEFASAIAVLVTLVYLAYQMRQNRNIAESEYHRDSVSLAGPVMEWIAKDASLASVLREGLIDLGALDDVGRMRFAALMNSFLLSFKSAMESYERGVMDKETYEAWELHVSLYLNMPGGDKWWEHAQLGFVPLVRERLADATKKAPRMDEFQPEIWGTA